MSDKLRYKEALMEESVSIRIPVEDKVKLQEAADKMGISLSDFIRLLIKQGLDGEVRVTIGNIKR